MDLPERTPLPTPPLFKTRMASGLVILIPLVITAAVIRFLFEFTSGILLPVIDPALADWPGIARAALSVLILLVVIYTLGALATNIVGRRVLSLGEQLVLRLPFVKVVYSVSKQVVAAFQGEGSKAFKSVVLVEFPHPGVRSIGFETGRLQRDDGSVWIMVFVPTTPNPTTGFLQLVPRASVEQTQYSVEEGIKMVMSLGVLVPE
jgi:uncharacterized membrane protein